MTPTNHKRDGLAWREVGPLNGDDGAQTVLFLHGLGGSRIGWEAQLNDLGDTFRCVAWDVPGYGDSDPLPEMSFPAIAEAAARLLDVLEVDRAHVVGLSVGGQQALYFAANHPDRLDRLVLADTSAEFGADGTSIEEWKQLRLAPLDAGQTPADMAEMVIDAITGPDFAGVERDRAIAAFNRVPSDGLRASVHCLPTNTARSRLNEIAAETLVVVGEHDDETPLVYSEVLRDEITNAKLVVISDVAHLTPSEAPQAFNTIIRDFLTPSDLPS